jgi:glycosyltransferase involved in cell wall biosynthesis
MKIAVDARELAAKPTGVGRYLAELLTEWSHAPDALRHHWTLYAPQPLLVPPPFDAAVCVMSGSSGTLWEQWTLARALRIARPDVLFAPAYTAPLAATCPVVLTMHDVAFSAHPEWFSFRDGARRRALSRLGAARARRVLTDSLFSRGEIARHLGVSEAKIRVIPLGVRRRPRALGSNHGRDREPLVLFVGSIFQRRHVDALVHAFGNYVVPRVPESRLEIVGENRAHPPVNLEHAVTLQSLEAQRRIAIRSYVSEEVLAELYARASVFVFPSEYEGFGLTPLEALAAGVAPVVLDTPIASEIYGPAARYVQNTTPMEERLGDAIAQLLVNAPARNELLRHADEVLSRYRWDRTARETLAALEEAARA